ncbi:MAG TPA: glycoside hydrolase family 2 TIM barrel-domain containing protein [Myxococcota bacterium]|nr:glycoside hydrolase family 2 TIM barrel-domain containing protein [Myxococcota bacterium]
MPRYDFNRGWTVESGERPAAPVTLPHDAMIHEPRDPCARNGANTGWYPGGVYTYRKRFFAPQAWRDRRVALFFEGAYHRSSVDLNGRRVGGRPSGYAEFHVELDGELVHGADNEVVVRVDTTDEPNSRWYSGSGLYRRVWLDVDRHTRIGRDGIRFRTVTLEDPALVIVEVFVDRAPPGADGAVQIDVELLAAGQPVARSTTSAPAATGVVTRVDAELRISGPKPWSSESPFLYDLIVRLADETGVLDEHRQRVGLRTVSVDARHGLRINGVSTKLRGACVHHDSGVLGAATFRAAELRRARILEEAGFNAIRSGHTPMGRDLLDACDEVGLYVVDELTDVWFVPKTAHDYARDFHDWWRADLASMVAKSRNHACVIMYSIGNENSETASAEGVDVGRAMAEHCRALDPTRPVTAAVNPMLNGLARVGIGVFDTEGASKKKTTTTTKKEKKRSARTRRELTDVGSAFFNAVMSRVGPVMNHVARLRFVDRATRDLFEVLDVAGYNYASGAYRADGKRHPLRVVVGSETLPPDIVRNWRQVEALPYLIGDFMWTGWDYLGEAGIAAWSYGADRAPHLKPYPFVSSGGGAVDLTGVPGAMALHARTAWGLRAEPAIVVRPLDRVAQKPMRSPWRTTDAIPSWSWPGHEGTTTEVLVFSRADTVELRLDGRSLGTRPAGRDRDCIARFHVRYRPGELIAIARTSAGTEVGRASLVSAGPDVGLQLRSDRNRLVGDGHDLAFVEVVLADGAGRVLPRSGVGLRAQVEGAGRLAGFGSADPKPLDSYTSGFHRTWEGRALAVVRAGFEPGRVMLTVAADGYGERGISLEVSPDTAGLLAL